MAGGVCSGPRAKASFLIDDILRTRPPPDDSEDSADGERLDVVSVDSAASASASASPSPSPCDLRQTLPPSAAPSAPQRRAGCWPERPLALYHHPQPPPPPPHVFAPAHGYCLPYAAAHLLDPTAAAAAAAAAAATVYKDAGGRFWSPVVAGCQLGGLLARHQHQHVHVHHQHQHAKRKGGQVRFTTEQTAALERRFCGHKYLSPEERRVLAAQLSLSDRQVKTWFQNRRAKWRRASQASDCSGAAASATKCDTSPGLPEASKPAPAPPTSTVASIRT